jgi:hypothetical protein
MQAFMDVLGSIFSSVWELLLPLLLALLVGGCVATHNGTYDWGFEVTTGYNFKQAVPGNDPASVKVDLQPAVDYVVQLRKDEPVPE